MLLSSSHFSGSSQHDMPTPPLAATPENACGQPETATSAAYPLVLFGSQTGNAADIADKVWRRALTLGVAGLRDVRVRSADAYVDEVGGALPPFPASEKLVVFVCATAGQGDPPDNMTLFWRRIMRKAVPAGACKDLKVAVLGLGDSSYPKYNFVAKKLFRRLLQVSGSIFAFFLLVHFYQLKEEHAISMLGA